MNFSRLILVLILATATAACTHAQSPLGGSASDQSATFAIYPDRVNARAELNYASKDSFGHPKTQILHFTVCLQNLVSGQNIVLGTPFAISDGIKAIERKTDVNGCIHWDESHAYSFFSPQRNLRVQRELRGLGNHRGTAPLTFNVKPWLDGQDAVQSELNQEIYAESVATSPTFGFDDSYPIDQTPQQAPRFDIADNHMDFRYLEIGRDAEFSIDPYLNLSIPYRFTFSFQPLITHQIFSGASVAEPIRSGKLRVTFVFFASAKGDPSQDTHYLTSAQVESEVGANGQFSGTVLLKYPHMLFASGRQTILIQVTAVDHPEIQTKSLSGSLSYLDQQTTLTLLADGRNAEALHQDSQRARLEAQSRRPTPLADFMSHHDLIVNQLSEFHSDLISQAELKYALSNENLSTKGWSGGRPSTMTVAMRLCRAYMKLNAIIDVNDSMGSTFCATDEGLKNFVKIQQLDFVEKVASTAPRNVKMYNFSNQEFGIYYSKEHDQSTITGFAMRVPGMSMFGGLFDFSFSRFDTQVSIQRGNFGSTQNMAVDVGTLEVNASLKSCVLISSVRTPFVQKPWLICDPTVKTAQWIPEKFFYYSQIWSSLHSPFIDPFSSQTGVKVFIRGKHHMQSILHVLQAADFQTTGFNVFVQAHVPDLSLFDTLRNLDSLTDQELAGAFERN